MSAYRAMAESMAREMATPAPMLESYGERPGVAEVAPRARLMRPVALTVVAASEDLVYRSDGAVFRRRMREGREWWEETTPIPGTPRAEAP